LQLQKVSAVSRFTIRCGNKGHRTATCPMTIVLQEGRKTALSHVLAAGG
jgi:hypothetical protein